jgi:hypothetical protein
MYGNLSIGVLAVIWADCCEGISLPFGYFDATELAARADRSIFDNLIKVIYKVITSVLPLRENCTAWLAQEMTSDP